MEKSKSFNGYSASYTEMRLGFEDRSKSYSFNGPSNTPDRWESSGNPELKRRRRVASYNMYTMEGKLKSSLRNSFKWIKSKFSDDIYDL
ncbi:ERCC4 domain-containing protein [Psidium guajava]|nr:ERCC4 domain-containing protein [Psidium guajava]